PEGGNSYGRFASSKREQPRRFAYRIECPAERRTVNAERLFQVGEISLSLDGCGASLTGGGDGLAIDRIGYVSRGEGPGKVGLRSLPLEKVAVLIHIYLSFERFGVWRMADGNENTFHSKRGK